MTFQQRKIYDYLTYDFLSWGSEDGKSFYSSTAVLFSVSWSQTQASLFYWHLRAGIWQSCQLQVVLQDLLPVPQHYSDRTVSLTDVREGFMFGVDGQWGELLCPDSLWLTGESDIQLQSIV